MTPSRSNLAVVRDLAIEPRGRPAYAARVGTRAVERLPELLPDGCARVALIADDTVGALHGRRLAAILERRAPVELLTFPAGEQHKNRATKERLEDSLGELGFARDGVIVALGGGVTLDLAGFVAATYMRGIEWIVVATSLLAAVDACIGGKVGVSTPRGKNLVGAYHHPRAVIVDLELIGSLPGREVDCGLAEMVKHAVIADRGHLHELVASASALRSLQPAVLLPLVCRSLEIKAAVVAEDPDERDRRQVLNFGHTVGHAIERVSGFSCSHGAAVAAGMVVEADIAHRIGLLRLADRDRIVQALRRLSLPTAPPAGLDAGDLLAATYADKKARGCAVRYALPAAVGEMARGARGFGHAVPDDVARAALEAAICNA